MENNFVDYLKINKDMKVLLGLIENDLKNDEKLKEVFKDKQIFLDTLKTFNFYNENEEKQYLFYYNYIYGKKNKSKGIN